MRVTVCELADDATGLEADWERLVAHVQEAGSDLLLLPEIPFSPWMFRQRSLVPATWREALAAHEAWLERLPEVAPAVVAGSRPVERDGVRLNEGFLWSQGQGYQPTHLKYYLPDEEGFWEASWYSRGDGNFVPASSLEARAGFLICTELWFMERARAYGQAGAHLLLTPRATERRTVEKWLVGGRAAAIVGGAYSLSSNKVEREGKPGELGGQGWVVDPDGEVLALTTSGQPFVTVEISLQQAEAARASYPRYVKE